MTQVQDSIRTNDYINTGERTSSQVQRPEDVAGSPAEGPVSSSDMGAAGLFGSQEASELRARWEKIQIEFVDEPRKSVQQADQLVTNVTERLAEMFRDQKNRLESDWDKGDKGESSTEELRTAFRRYRTLFDRLLSI